MLTLLKVAGGVALLMLGVRYLRKGLDRLFGARLAGWMRRLGSRPGLPFITGLISGVVAPSSTTISLLAVQTVQTGAMTIPQMLAVMLGANVGLTVLVQLVALRLDEYAPIFVLIGFVLFQFTTNSRVRGVGQTILAMGFFFLAMWVIRRTVTDDQINSSTDLRELISIAGKYPFWMALLATLMATLLQGATATIGLIIGLSAIDGFGMHLILPVVVGANVGQGLTTLIYGWRQIDSRRLGAANFLLKMICGAALLAALPWLGPWLDQHFPGSLPHRVANLHTAFNLLLAAIGLPLVGWVSHALELMIPPPSADSPRAFGPKFIHHGPIDGVRLAQGQSLREIMYMSEIVRSMMHDVWAAMKTSNERLARHVQDRDNKVDLLDGEIKRFLTRLVKEEIERGDADEQIRQLQYLADLETVGDIIDKNLAELVLKKIRLAAAFSPEGERELDDVYQRVTENMMIADTVFTTKDRKLAEKLLRHKDWLNRHEMELRDRHYARLNKGLPQSLDSSAIHLDLLTHLKRINSCVTHVAYPILQNGRSTDHADDATAAPAVE